MRCVLKKKCTIIYKLFMWCAFSKISIKKCIIIYVVLNCPFSSLNSHFCARICRECLVEKKKSLSVCTKVIGADGRRKLVMSNRGWESLTSEQREALVMVIFVMAVMVVIVVMALFMVVIQITMKLACQIWKIESFLILLVFNQAGVDPVLCNVPTIERVGGGGIRWSIF